ncbi:hypothetical protein [uncultured Paraglaciecola sp.]|uniref:hypothetical protein n=1 Tax=uncultured Paraglaciecola sp. TaxID=1765024 RepID=UPI002607FEE5|nr:hypothetical protein [uncultured Paraglaciecola sp.]
MIEKFTPRLILIGLIVFIASCSSQLQNVLLLDRVTPQLNPEKEFVPVKLTASVGEIMLTSGQYLKEPSETHLGSFHVDENIMAKVDHKMQTFEFSLPTGDYQLRSITNRGKYYSSASPFNSLNGTNKAFGGLFIPTGSTEATEFYWSWHFPASAIYQAKLASPLTILNGKYKAYLKAQERSNVNITLTYIGVAAGQIKFVYKEFTDEWLARAAFTQEVSLDYKAGGTYAYKNARFSVEEADSTHIKFTLLSPF